MKISHKVVSTTQVKSLQEQFALIEEALKTILNFITVSVY